MHHSTAQDLQPARPSAYRTAFPSTNETFDIHLGAGFGEGKVRGSKTITHLLTKHTSGKVAQSALQIAECDVLPYRQSLDLVELHFMSSGDLFVAVAHPGQDDAHWLRVIWIRSTEFAHRMYLTRRGMRTKQDRVVAALCSAIDEQCVLHLTCRVVRREIEKLEVIFVCLNFP